MVYDAANDVHTKVEDKGISHSSIGPVHVHFKGC